MRCALLIRGPLCRIVYLQAWVYWTLFCEYFVNILTWVLINDNCLVRHIVGSPKGSSYSPHCWLVISWEIHSSWKGAMCNSDNFRANSLWKTIRYVLIALSFLFHGLNGGHGRGKCTFFYNTKTGLSLLHWSCDSQASYRYRHYFFLLPLSLFHSHSNKSRQWFYWKHWSILKLSIIKKMIDCEPIQSYLYLYLDWVTI